MKLKFVSCTSNSLAQTCDSRKCTELLLILILSLRDLLQNQSLEIIQVCIVVLCFPHNSIVGTHLCDECTRSNAPSVSHKLSSICVTARASLHTDHKMSGLPIRARHRRLRKKCEQTVDNSPTDSLSSSLN